jgi:phage terminase large subunit
MAGIGQFILEFRKAGLEAKQIWGDNGGMGKVMVDALSQAGWSINRFNFGAKPSNEFAFVSRGAEAWFNFGRQVTNGELSLIRDETLIAQLTSGKTTCDSRGRIKLESKDELRARGLKSPDRADAVVGAFALRGAGVGSNYINGRRRDWMGEMQEQPGHGSDADILRQLGGFTG